MHTAHVCPSRSMHSMAHTNADTQYSLRNFTGKSSWQIKEYTHRDEPFRMFENLPKDVFLKTNYPCGCVKEWPLLFPAHIRIPQIIRRYFFPRPMWAKSGALDIQSSFTNERNHFKNTFFIVFICQKVLHYMTTCHVRHEFTVLFLFIFSLMTMCFWMYLIGFEMVSWIKGVYVLLITLTSL